MRLIFRIGFALTLLVAALAVAHAHPGTDWDDELGWAILHDDHRRTSTLHGLDEIEDLQSRFGDDLLYIRDGDERYVITDRALIERAEEAAHRIVDPAKAMAKAEARLAVRQAHSAKAWVKLQNAEAQLEAAIEKQERRGDDAEELRDALERVREELEQIQEHG
ncbi:MAG TPA: hypothetical protein VFP58_03495, partial [Candidatus Eisenbacteria bacterium]|nr:hypothetical protein [Candidatus Eisenbacteria bacterium]